MRFSLLYISDKPSAWAEQICCHYEQRIPNEFKFSSTRIPPLKRNKNTVIETLREQEWSRIKNKMNKHALTVLLDEHGQSMTSMQFAESIRQWQQAGQDVDFVIAGADGVNPNIRNEVDMVLSLSKLTFPHELARVIMLEQIYRAWSILANHPYHRS